MIPHDVRDLAQGAQKDPSKINDLLKALTPYIKMRVRWKKTIYQDADDIVQVVLTNIFQAIHRIDLDGNLLAWINCICDRACTGDTKHRLRGKRSPKAGQSLSSLDVALYHNDENETVASTIAARIDPYAPNLDAAQIARECAEAIIDARLSPTELGHYLLLLMGMSGDNSCEVMRCTWRSHDNSRCRARRKIFDHNRMKSIIRR